MFRRRKYGKMKKTLLPAALMILIQSGSAVYAQDLPPAAPTAAPSVHTRMYTGFLNAQKLAETLDTERFIAEMRFRGITVREDRKVYVEIFGPEGGTAVTQSQLDPFGGEIFNTWRHQCTAFIPVDELDDFERTLREGYFMMPVLEPNPDEVAGEGPAATGSDEYRDHGANGAGVTIAIIDYGYFNLPEAMGNGDVPDSTRCTFINYSATAFYDSASGTHGTGCVEAAFDHCPDAIWRLYKIDSSTDLGTAVSDCITEGVDVISLSNSYYNTGWEDDTGTPCIAANNAASNGIVFFTSAGNRAQSHYQDVFNDPDSDNWHNFDPVEECISITMPAEGRSRFYLCWDRTGGTYDYDLIIWDDAIEDTIAIGNNVGTAYEWCIYENTGSSSETIKLSILKKSGGSTELEVFMHKTGTWEEHITEWSSTTSPSNSTEPLVISVGAVAHGDFGSPNGTTGINKSYSSQGPSNSGMILPDLCGPTDTDGFTYPSGFGGTSCATPNSAGAATAFWSSEPPITGENVQELLFIMADLFRDWGTTGNDNIYGRGGVTAPKNHVSIVLINRMLGNTAASTERPYYYVDDAYTYVSGGGRMIFFGDTYPENPITFSKILTVENYGNTARVGGP